MAFTSSPDPTTPILAALERIDARLTALEHRLAGLEQIPNAVATLVDTLDSAVARLSAQGIEVDDRMKNTLKLLEKLTEPSTFAAIENVMARLPQLDNQLKALDQAPATLAMLVDIGDGWASRLAAKGVDIDRRLSLFAEAAERLTSPEALTLLNQLLQHVGELQGLLSSGILEPGPVRMVGQMGRALASTAASENTPLGAFGAIRAISDPRIQQAIGFLVRFGKLLGQELGHPHSAAPQLAAPQT